MFINIQHIHIHKFSLLNYKFNSQFAITLPLRKGCLLPDYINKTFHCDQTKRVSRIGVTGASLLRYASIIRQRSTRSDGIREFSGLQYLDLPLQVAMDDDEERVWGKEMSALTKWDNSKKKTKAGGCMAWLRGTKVKNHDLEDFEMQIVRYKPEGLDELTKTTKFTRKELQMMYRGFKQECPTGIVNEDTFKEIYAQFFPQGDSAQYAHYVFNSFDADHNGTISFEEFVLGLSVLSRGNLSEKLNWAFNLYDINGDGYITREEMYDVVTAIYDMMGKYSEAVTEELNPKEHAERVFQKLDMNRDGVITLDEFIDSCKRDDQLAKSMSVFDTVL